MTIRLNPRWLLVSALLFSLQFSRAQVVVPPTLSFDLGTESSPESRLWDLGGSYSLDTVIRQRNSVVEVPVQISFTLVQSPAGKLTGPPADSIDGLVVNNDQNSFFALTTKVSGKVTTASFGTARVHFTVHFSGSGKLANQDTTVNGSFTVDAETDPDSGELVGVKTSKFSAKFSGAGGLSGQADFETALPPGVNGSWNLTLNLVALSKITGNGTIRTPSRTLGLDLSGVSRRGKFNIKAKGANDVQDAQNGTGSSATIQLTPPFDSILLKGKLLGQKMLFSFPPDSGSAN